MARAGPRPAGASELREALAACWHAFIAVGLMSGLINILYLTGSFYMLEVYDRVLPSRSVPTLIGLAVIAFVLYAFQVCCADACSSVSAPRSTKP
jgi:ATP-binding cassette subfamily C protein